MVWWISATAWAVSLDEDIAYLEWRDRVGGIMILALVVAVVIVVVRPWRYGALGKLAPLVAIGGVALAAIDLKIAVIMIGVAVLAIGGAALTRWLDRKGMGG